MHHGISIDFQFNQPQRATTDPNRYWDFGPGRYLYIIKNERKKSYELIILHFFSRQLQAGSLVCLWINASKLGGDKQMYFGLVADRKLVSKSFVSVRLLKYDHLQEVMISMSRMFDHFC